VSATQYRTPDRRIFLTPPTVEEYARMNQALRLEFARAVEEARRMLRAAPPPRRADDYGPEETLMAARALLPVIARRWPDPPHVKRDRLMAANAEAATWIDRRRHPGRAREGRVA
jgi:hypothetical protein